MNHVEAGKQAAIGIGSGMYISSWSVSTLALTTDPLLQLGHCLGVLAIAGAVDSSE
jgi:hypothetical protein